MGKEGKHDMHFLGRPPPVFDGTNYATWKRLMEEHLSSLDYYGTLQHIVTQNKTFPCSSCQYARAKILLISALSEGEAAKVRNCHSAKEIWDTLQAIYGNPHVTKASLALLGSEFDSFTMKPNETISDMYSRFIDKIITPMFDLGRVVTDQEQIKKILSIIPPNYSKQVFKQVMDVDSMKTADLIGFLIACDMYKASEVAATTSVPSEDKDETTLMATKRRINGKTATT